MLTVPEEFAGQLMKCPLCAGTFTVPGLPGAAPAPTTPEPDTYSIHPEDSATLPPLPEEPALTSREPVPSPPSPTPTPSPSPTPAPVPSLSSPTAEGHRRAASLSINPHVLHWVAPVCLILVFFLLFFNWLGLYPGGVPAATQSAWQAAFGFFTLDGDMADLVPVFKEDKYKPGASVLTIFYLLLFFPVLLVTIASIAIDFVKLKLPPAVEKLIPWRWGIVAAGNLIVFLFLALQLLLGFSLDTRYGEWVDSQFDTQAVKKTDQQKVEAARRGELMNVLYHARALRLAILLHLLAVLCSALMFWVTQRGTTRPLPQMELRW
jgi:hypothetical protein